MFTEFFKRSSGVEFDSEWEKVKNGHFVERAGGKRKKKWRFECGKLAWNLKKKKSECVSNRWWIIAVNGIQNWLGFRLVWRLLFQTSLMHLTRQKRNATQRKEYEQRGEIVAAGWWQRANLGKKDWGWSTHIRATMAHFWRASLNDPNDVVLLARYEQMGWPLPQLQSPHHHQTPRNRTSKIGPRMATESTKNWLRNDGHVFIWWFDD